ncbi:hypothetical protein GGR56DRAFT_457636 [Xylariaceae sp. FL0804]|nr:hypothetical protein GGR56DRAFT_457636 [Xylariaceae sp. FL0804]
MSSETPSNGAAAVASPPPPKKRFELPALNFKFGSLTEGTDIPAPLPSPKQEAPVQVPPETPVTDEEPKKQENGATNGYGTYPNMEIDTSVSNTTLKRPLDVPASPAASNRGSLRRLLSKNLLNSAYDEQGSVAGLGVSRPPSRTASTIAEDRKSKRSSGWFRRLRSHDSSNAAKSSNVAKSSNAVKRTSQLPEEPQEPPKKPMGPPPPMIPELSALESKVDTNMGDDLFKGIGK